MKNLFKGLELDMEKDGLATAIAKGALEGAIKYSVVSLAIGGALLLVGKSLDGIRETDKELEELQNRKEELDREVKLFGGEE